VLNGANVLVIDPDYNKLPIESRLEAEKILQSLRPPQFYLGVIRTIRNHILLIHPYR
jgi:hypothetical protein